MLESVQKKVLILALFAGEIMMKSGAEIYRVEDTIVRICKACKIDYAECFATTTGIFVSIDRGEEKDNTHTFIKRIKGTDINLAKISAVNNFSRDFTTTDLSIEAGFEQLKKINAEPGYGVLLRVIGALLVGMFFCPIYGGSLGDMFIAGLIACVSYLLSIFIRRLGFPDFIRIFISCAGAAGMVLAAAAMGASDSISPVVVAATTIFLPGVAITNAARDLLSGDMLSGTSRLVEACLTAIAIAGGIGIGMQIWLLGGGTIMHDRIVTFEAPWFLLFGSCATLGFGLIFNAPKKLLIPIAIIGGVGMFTLLSMTKEYGLISASFFGACAIAILAEFASRAGKDATTLFIIPGIIPFVPGEPLYKTMNYMLIGDYSMAITIGTQAFIIAGSIAAALVFVAAFARLILAVINRIRRRHNRL